MDDFKVGDRVIHSLIDQTGSKTNKRKAKVTEHKAVIIQVMAKTCLIRYESKPYSRVIKKSLIKKIS